LSYQNSLECAPGEAPAPHHGGFLRRRQGRRVLRDDGFVLHGERAVRVLAGARSVVVCVCFTSARPAQRRAVKIPFEGWWLQVWYRYPSPNMLTLDPKPCGLCREMRPVDRGGEDSFGGCVELIVREPSGAERETVRRKSAQATTGSVARVSKGNPTAGWVPRGTHPE
jgi:hypothetical protein